MPILQIGKKTGDQRSVGLIFDRRFQPPFVVVTADVDPVIAILNHDAVDLGAIKINNVLRLARGFSGAGPISFDENKISKNRGRDDE